MARSSFWRRLGALVKETASDWKDDKASRLAAALAYYTALSIAPLLVISIAVAGLVFGADAARGAIMEQLGGLISPDSAETSNRWSRARHARARECSRPSSAS